MYEEVAKMLIQLTPWVAVLSFFVGLVYGVKCFMDGGDVVISMLTPVVTLTMGGAGWFFGSLIWPLTITLLVVFTVAFLVKLRRMNHSLSRTAPCWSKTKQTKNAAKTLDDER